MEKYGFGYIWYDRKHKRYYIGAHWGREDDSYICSSPWMKQAYKHRPEDFKRRILFKNYISKKDTFNEEYKWLSLIKEDELGKRYYNLNNNPYKHPSGNLSAREKISLSHKNDPNWGNWAIGKEVTELTKEKLRQANLGKKSSSTSEKIKNLWKTPVYRQMMIEKHQGKKQSKESLEKRINTIKEKGIKLGPPKGTSPPNKGKKSSEETKQKLKEAWKQRKINYPMTEETKQKLKKSIKNRKRDNKGRLI